MDDVSYKKTAVSVWAMRDALLYFDNVISITGPLEVGWAIGVERRSHPEKYGDKEVLEISRGLIMDVLPEHLKHDVFKSKLGDFYSFTSHYFTEKVKEH